jgi:AraC family transcriptional regulator
MSDSARDKHATAFEPGSYATYQSVVPSAFEPGAPPEFNIQTDFNATRRLHLRTAPAADRIVQIFPSDAVNRRTAQWPGMEVEIVEANRRGRIDYHSCAPFPMLVVHERGMRHDGCTVIDGLPKSTLQDCSRKLVFVPAHRKYHDWHEQRTLSRVIFFHLNPAGLAMSPELSHSITSLAPRLFFENGALMETASKLVALIESGGADHRLYIEALGVVLTHELVRINAGKHRAEAPINGGLGAWQRRKARAYIEAHLAEPISLAALAQLVGLSASYFCRAFSQSFGMPPRRYQLSQRIERARILLANQFASVTDVGLTVGYNDASAFSTAFRKVTGLSPRAYRRNLG